MLFHVTFEVYEEIVLPEVRTLLNEWLGPQYKLFGPEFYDSCRIDAQPVVPVETAGQIFGRWAEEGR